MAVSQKIGISSAMTVEPWLKNIFFTLAYDYEWHYCLDFKLQRNPLMLAWPDYESLLYHAFAINEIETSGGSALPVTFKG